MTQNPSAATKLQTPENAKSRIPNPNSPTTKHSAANLLSIAFLAFSDPSFLPNLRV
ncbi:hypothetical protein ACLOJK_008098 [Asimina triloba]